VNGKFKYLVLGMFCLISFPLFSQNAYLELNLNETPGGSPFSDAKQPLEVFRVIEKASNDNKVKGIVLNIGAISGSRTYLWELRSVLEQFKDGGKKICAFIGSADIDAYCLASVADKIVMDELGTLSLLGYSVNRGYLKNTLDKLGIGARELRYFQYKSAAEAYTRVSMSEADRRQYNEYLDDIFNLTRDTLKKARNWTDEDFNSAVNRDFLFSAKGAHSRGIVDYIGRNAAVKEAIREIEGEEVRNFYLYGDSETSLMGKNTEYKPVKAGGLFQSPPVIAVVYAEGQTDMERGMSIFNLSKTIVELADKSRVKAIVIRINSPGGSADAADHFAEAVRYAKIRKPVVVSMGEVAASGGYWAAMNADSIFAAPATITGSIGVIGSWFYDKGFNSKLGMTSDRIQRGAHADLFTGAFLPYRDLTAQEEERYKSYILDIYANFIEKVALGRTMTVEKVEAAAQGRVYSGTRALEAGLIDKIGGLYDAVVCARSLANISDDTKVKYEEYPKPKFFDKLMKSLLMKVGIAHSKPAQSGMFALFSDILLLDANIRYRLENNGRVMPILPLDFTF